MNILIITPNNQVANEIKETVNKDIIGGNFDVVVDISHARYQVRSKEYKIVVIDMMSQEFFNMNTKPILYSPTSFIKKLKIENPQLKIFALFNENKTGKKGQDEIKELGYEVGAYSFISNEWRKRLKKYMY